ncbi:MAG: SPFH domain-containing protein [bacterium]
MTRTLIKLALLVIVFAAVAVVLRFCFQKVPLDRVGVRTWLLGGGVDRRDLGPGFYLVVPGVHRLDLMDPTIQFLTMAPNHEAPALKLIGKDQYATEVDVTVVYRLQPGKAHAALLKYGAGELYRSKLRSRADKIIWETLGELATEDFYNTTKRHNAAEKARDGMNKSFQEETDPFEVVNVLIRNVKYDPLFEKRLLEKQIFDQSQRLNSALTLKEKELEKTQTIEKQTTAKVVAIQEDMAQAIKTLIAESDARIAQIEADANLYAHTKLSDAEREKREKTAAGELEKTVAKAKGEKAVNQAYIGFGGQLYLAKKTIENLQLGEIEINTNQTNPFDAEQMLKLVGATGMVPDTSQK